MASIYSRDVFKPHINVVMYVFKNVKSVQLLLLLHFTSFISKQGLISVSIHQNSIEIKESLLNYEMFWKLYPNTQLFSQTLKINLKISSLMLKVTGIFMIIFILQIISFLFLYLQGKTQLYLVCSKRPQNFN